MKLMTNYMTLRIKMNIKYQNYFNGVRIDICKYSSKCLEFTCLVLHCRSSGRRHFAASILKQPAPQLPTPVLTVPASPPPTPTPGAGRSSESDKRGFLQFSKWHLSPCISCSIYHFGFKRLSTSNCKKAAKTGMKKSKLSKIIGDNQSKD